MDLSVSAPLPLHIGLISGGGGSSEVTLQTVWEAKQRQVGSVSIVVAPFMKLI